METIPCLSKGYYPRLHPEDSIPLLSRGYYQGRTFRWRLSLAYPKDTIPGSVLGIVSNMYPFSIFFYFFSRGQQSQQPSAAPRCIAQPDEALVFEKVPAVVARIGASLVGRRPLLPARGEGGPTPDAKSAARHQGSKPDRQGIWQAAAVQKK